MNLFIDSGLAPVLSEMSDETSPSRPGSHCASEGQGLSAFAFTPSRTFKAPFFTNLGYTRGNWRRLERDLLVIAVSGDGERGKDSPYGEKYEIRGTLNGPSDRSAAVLTVWIILFGGDVPQFVTAFPGEKT